MSLKTKLAVDLLSAFVKGISISALALILFVLALLGLRLLSAQFQSVLSLNLSHGLLTSIQVSLHLSLAFEGLSCQHFESLFNVSVFARRSLQELHTFASTKLLRC